MTYANVPTPFPFDGHILIGRNPLKACSLERKATCKDELQVDGQNRGGWLGFVVANRQDTRYTSNSKAAGPLPQGTLSLGGSFFSCGGGR